MKETADRKFSKSAVIENKAEVSRNDFSSFEAKLSMR